MKRLILVAVVCGLFGLAVIIGARPIAASSTDPGGWSYCSGATSGAVVYDPMTFGYYRCTFGYYPGLGAYSPTKGFIGSCPAGAPYYGWCWYWYRYG